MESNSFTNFIHISLYNVFKDDFLLQKDRWTDYIESKDLGVVSCFNSNNNSLYKIVDEKKWLLAKIKYGL